MTLRLASLLIASAIASIAHADVIDTTWLGGTGEWHDPTRWSAGVVPFDHDNTQFDVRILNGSVKIAPLTGTSVSTLTVGAGGTLSVDSGSSIYRHATFDGHVHVHRSFSVGTLAGSGTVTVNNDQPFGYATFYSSEPFVIPAGLHVQVGRQADVGSPFTPFTNQGHIIGGAGVGNFASRVGGTQFSNIGTIEARDGVIGFMGDYTRAALGNLVWGESGRFSIEFYGTLLNDGQTFNVNPDEPWLMTGGTIRGGTLNIAPGSELLIPDLPGDEFGTGGQLDDVIINGRITHAGSGPLYVSNVVQGNADIHLSGAIPAGASRISGGLGSLVISSTVHVHGGGNMAGFLGNAAGIGYGYVPLVNHGTIGAEVPAVGSSEFDLIGPSVYNDGTIAIASGAFLYAAEDNDQSTIVTFGPGGILHIGPGGLLWIVGQLDLSTAGDQLIITRATEPNGPFFRIAKTTQPILGQFDFVTPGFQLDYRGAEIWARYIPEPAGGLIPAALGSLRLARRRRRRHTL